MSRGHRIGLVVTAATVVVLVVFAVLSGHRVTNSARQGNLEWQSHMRQIAVADHAQNIADHQTRVTNRTPAISRQTSALVQPVPVMTSVRFSNGDVQPAGNGFEPVQLTAPEAISTPYSADFVLFGQYVEIDLSGKNPAVKAQADGGQPRALILPPATYTAPQSVLLDFGSRQQGLHVHIDLVGEIRALSTDGDLQPARAASKPPLQVVFLGDSYSAGVGADAPFDGYASLVGKAKHWNVVNSSIGGTGYVNPGPFPNGAFSDRAVHDAVRETPQVLFVQAGLNDVAYNPAGVVLAAGQLYSRLRAALPLTKIVVIGPLQPGNFHTATLAAMNTGLRQAAQSAGVGYIDTLSEDWFIGAAANGWLSSDHLHPSTRGHAIIAGRLLQDLGAFGL